MPENDLAGKRLSVIARSAVAERLVGTAVIC